MLDDLDKFDWASLHHAYGSAADVPGLLKALASDNPDAAKEAVENLFGNIYHQTTVYEATAPAVPFLVELLVRKENLERPSLVMLLACIADGGSSDDRIGSRARAAVQTGADEYWKLLDDPTIRLAIPYLLSKLPAEVQRIRAAVPKLIGSRNDALFDASLLILLAHVVQIDDEGFLLRFLWQAEIPLLRLGAALGILRIGTKIQYLEEALRIYFDALRWAEECRDQIPTDPSWLWAGELWFLLNIWSDQFTPEARSAFRRCLPAALPALPEYAASELARLNMRIGFDQDNLPKSKAELTPVQWALLEALARDTNVLHNDPLILGVLYTLALPNDMKSLQAFLTNS